MSGFATYISDLSNGLRMRWDINIYLHAEHTFFAIFVQQYAYLNK